MNRPQWERVEALFVQACAQPAGERAAFLEACCDEPALRLLVLELLAADAQPDDMLAELIAGQAAALTRDERSGHRLGPWAVQRFLGEGGSSAVYLATRADEQFHKRVALKVLKRGRDTVALVSRFHLERHILAGLEHPNLARLIDAGTTDDGLPYFVMEYVEGAPLDRWCDERRLGPRARVELFLQVLAAVAYLHRNLIVHRDLKPSNILVTADGTAKLLDLGIAKLLDPERVGPDVRAAELVAPALTPAYASPEQHRGDAITTASDVYSLGVLLAELLAGRRPPPAPQRAAAGQRDASHELWPSRLLRRAVGPDALTAEELAARRGLAPAALARQLQGDLDAVVSQALASNPERRFASVDAFAEDLRRHLAGWPVAARGDAWSYRMAKFLVRQRLPVTLAALAALALVLTLVGLFVQSARLQQARDVSERQRLRAEQVSSLLVDIFQVSDPGVAQGRNVTARELLDRGARRVQSELGGEPQVRAAMLATIAKVYRQLGLYHEAEPLAEQALLELRRGGDRLHLGDALNELAVLRASLGQYERAEPLFREALAVRRAVHGEQDERVAAALNNLALLQHDRGHYAEAAHLYREALARDEQRFGRHDPRTLTGLSNLGLLEHDLGRDQEAERLLREVLAAREQRHGTRHPDVAETLALLGRVLGSQGYLDEAEAVLERALALERELRGGQHPDAARVLAELGSIARRRGQLARAEAFYRRALELQVARLGRAHPESAWTQVGLAECLLADGRTEAAEATLQPALRALQAALGDGHPGLLPAHVLAAEIAGARAQPASVAQHLAVAHALARARLPAEHPMHARLRAVAERLGYVQP
jgi:serine/threonine-protein kinase